MKTLAKYFLAMAGGAALLQTALGATDKTAPAKNTPAKPALTKPAAPKAAPVRSVFVMPTNAREGRDPFFPESPRPFEAATAAATRNVVEA
ncbi:MAG: hypothetical protein WCJ07_11120, partial [Verrucomicrobiota bacterium]